MLDVRNMKPQQPLSRRDFLKIFTATAGAGALIGGGLLRHSIIPQGKAHEVLQQTKPIMGTWVTITVHHHNLVEAQSAMNKAFAAVAKVDRVMSVHRPASDLSRVNQAAGNDIVQVDASLIDILSRAAHTHEQSGGIYDVTCLPLMKLYGFYQHAENKTFPSESKVLDTIKLINQRNITIDAATQCVGLQHANMGIDLGSIGKGYAVDLAAQTLQEAGINNALVDAGGNIFALGAPFGNEDPSTGWRIAIRNPYAQGEDDFFETLTLRNQAVATSGNYENYQCLNKHQVGHILNALTGKPMDVVISSTVVTDNATSADALSTTTFLMGSEKAAQFNNANTHVYFHSNNEVKYRSEC